MIHPPPSTAGLFHPPLVRFPLPIAIYNYAELRTKRGTRGRKPGGNEGRKEGRKIHLAILWSHRQHLSLMNIQRSNPINIHTRYGRSRHKSHDFDELSCLRSTESNQSFSPNLGSPSPPETPDSSHCISRIGDYLLLEPLEGDHVFRAAHLHSGEELVCKVGTTHADVVAFLSFISFLCVLHVRHPLCAPFKMSPTTPLPIL